jgi:hypothetical protein
MLHILVIDDNPIDRLLVIRELEREFTSLQIREITNPQTLEEAITEGNFDAVVTDYQLGWSNGLVVLQSIKSRYPNCPVVMFTNSGNEEIAVEAMKSGLDDYIIKAPNRYKRVPIALHLAIERAEVRSRATRLEAEREQLLAQERAARQEAETANRLKDEFLATLSHELRTPLNSILGWAQMLRLKRLKENDYTRAVESIERNSKSLTALIEDLLDVSRIITGNLSLNFQPIELASVIEAALNTVRPAAQAKAITILYFNNSKVSPILGDATRLQQVMWNLLSNAVKFTPPKGQVQIRLRQIEDSVIIIVSDTGQGIEPEFLPYVFDRFRQADSSSTRLQGGLGLGLSIVRHLVELHGGTVQAQSPGLGEGTTFTLKFPAQRDRTQATNSEVEPTTVEPSSVSLAGLRVLVVDDEADTRDLLKFVLKQCEAEVIAVDSVPEALKALKEFMPDVLVSDIGMPVEDGYALIRQVRAMPEASLSQIPAIALTAFANQSDRDRTLEAGFQMHLPKPVEPDELVRALAKLAEGIASLVGREQDLPERQW